MFSRCSLSAALLAACVVAVAAPPVRADAKKTELQRKIYPVADLIVLVSSDSDIMKSEQPGQPIKNLEAKLIKLITSTIEPDSWVDAGGQGTIDFFPLSGSLVVNQTLDVHEQIGDLLTAVRRFGEQEVSLEVRIVTVRDDGCERIGVDFNNTTGVTPQPAIKVMEPIIVGKKMVRFLSDAQAKVLMEAIQSDPNTNVMQTPKLTLRSGQAGHLCICCPDEQSRTCDPVPMTGCTPMPPAAQAEEAAQRFRMSALPAVSVDRHFVRVALNIDQPGKVSLRSTVVIPDGGTAVFCGSKKVISVQKECGCPVFSRIPYLNRCFTTMGYVPVTQHTFALVTPRILPLAEEEERQTGFTMSPCEPASNLCPGEPTNQPMQGMTIVPIMRGWVTNFWGELYQPYQPSAGLTLPQPRYLEHPPQYTPPSQPLCVQAPQNPSPNCTSDYPSGAHNTRGVQAPQGTSPNCTTLLQTPGGLVGASTFGGVSSPNCTTSLQTCQSPQPPQPQWGQASQVPSGYYRAAAATSAAQYVSRATEGGAKGRQASVLAELLKAYDEACAAGHASEAKKYARAALLIDPTCFHKK